jgi:hypothetical protein
MNTKGIKFLAVLAVLAMAFAACAVAYAPVDAEDSDREKVGLVDDPEYSLAVTEGFTGTINFYTPLLDLIPDKKIQGSGNTFVLPMVGISTNNTVKDSAKESPQVVSNWGNTTGYAFFTINFTDFTSTSNDTVWMYQKNTALSLADGNDAIDNKKTKPVAGTPYTERLSAWNYASALSGGEYSSDLGVLIPQDGSSIVLEFYAADSTKVTYEGDITKDRAKLTGLTLIASFTIDTEKMYTLVNLDTIGANYPYAAYTKANTNYKDWAFNNETKTLTGTLGSNVGFYGNGIKAGTGITDAMMKDAGFNVKLVQNSTTTYYSSFNAAIADVSADAAITLLDDCEADGFTYTQKNALTIDLNSKELTFVEYEKSMYAEGVIEILNVGKAVEIRNGTIDVGFIGISGLALIENFNVNTTITNVKVCGENFDKNEYKWNTVIFNRNGNLTLAGSTTVTSGDAAYAIVSDSFNHTHEGVAYTGSLVTIASSDVKVDGNMLVSNSSTGGIWAAEELKGKGFAISNGTFTGTLDRKDIANFVDYTLGDFTATYGNSFFLSGGKFIEYGALVYVVDGKSIVIEDGGQGVPAGPAQGVAITEGTVTIPDNLKTGEINTLVMGSGAPVTKIEADIATKDVVLIGQGQALSGVKLSVNGAGAVAFYGFASVTGEITTGTGASAQKIKLDAAKGEFTVSQGSIVVNTDWEGGKILLRNGDVLKLSGNILENSYIEKDPEDTSTSFSAKVIIEAGDAKALYIADEKTLEVKAGIAVEIEGTVAGLGTLAVAKSITVKDGGVLATDVTEATTNTVYSGGDINYAGIDITLWTGKDAASGTWSYTGTVLTLNNYNGTYNFAQVPAGITEIKLNGDSVISVSYPILRDIDPDDDEIDNVLFGGDAFKKISTEGAGSLKINVDISKAENEELPDADVPLTVVKGVNAGTEPLKINGVGLAITVTGSNPEWKSEYTDAMVIFGIYSGIGVDFFEAPVGIAIMPDYESEGLVGIWTPVLNITGKGAIISAQEAIITANMEVKTSTVGINGDAAVLTQLTISNKSYFEVTKDFLSLDTSVSQESQLVINDGRIGALKNFGDVNFKGNVMVLGDIENNAVMDNDGVLGIYGSLNNKAPGVFTNDGVLSVYPMKQKLDGEEDPITTAAITITDVAASANNARLKSIALTHIAPTFDGSFEFDATITVYKSEGYSEVSDEFEGFITPAANGSYLLTMSSKTASITIAFDATDTTGPDKVGKAYAITVTGTVKVGDDNLYLQANTVTAGSEATVATDTTKKDVLFVDSGAGFTVTSGTFDNNGTVTVSSVTAAEIIKSDATYNGDLVTTVEAVTISGAFNGDLTATGAGKATVSTFNGDIHAAGTVEVKSGKTMTGDIYALKGVDIEGTFIGDFETEGSAVIAKMTGIATFNRTNTDLDLKTVTVKDLSNITIVYNSYYKETKDATVPTEYTAVMTVEGKAAGLVIDLAKGADATTTTAVVPGYFRINATGALDENKTVDMGLTEGKLLVDSAVVLEKRYYLTIEAGATIEVNKSAASLDVKNAALKVNKDAIANFETGPGVPVNYGKVLSVMSFTIDGGEYTIYSDVAYALMKCNEGATLYLDENAEIDQDVTVKAGVTIVVEDVTLTFTGKDVAMPSDSKIALVGTGKVVFMVSGDDTATVDASTTLNDYTYYDVDATVIYEDNSVIFSGVRFTDESTIVGIAATSTAVAKIGVTLTYNEGTATIDDGVGSGSVTIQNSSYYLSKSDKATADITKKEKVYGTFVIGPEAIFDALELKDAFKMVDYKIDDDDEAYIDFVRLDPTIVGVEGILNLVNGAEIKGVYAGLGVVMLAEGKELKFAESNGIPGVDTENQSVPGVAAVKVVDTTFGMNGYVLNLVSPTEGQTLTLKATTQKIGSETVNVMTIKGDLGYGIATATTAAFVDGVDIQKDAEIIGDVVYIIGDSEANGLLGAKEIHMKEGAAASEWKTLDYEAVYEDEGYTFYTMLRNVDLDEVTDIYLAATVGIEKLDVSGKDTTITIAEGKELRIAEN